MCSLYEVTHIFINFVIEQLHAMKKRTKILLACVALCVAFVAVIAPFVFTGAPCDGMVKVRKGSTIDMVQDSIEAHVDVAFARKVSTLLRLTGTDLSHRQGAFKVNKGDSPFKVMRLLRSGAESAIRFTFNNLRTKEEFARRFSDKFMYPMDSVMTALNDSATCARFDRTPDNITGMLSPDTYEFYWDITPVKMLDVFDSFDKRFWTDERLAKAEALGVTPHQLEIIASITEEETAKQDERGKVARLYINRLKQDMPLQADPTVKFALGDFSIKRLTINMTRIDSPWNTYRNPGLPPGPIRLPEKKTIDAALNAQPHDNIYMCAREDFSGYHNFAVDYATHMANARRYQAELNKLDIK